MLAVIVHRVATIDMTVYVAVNVVPPGRVSEKLMLRLVWPVAVAMRMGVVTPGNFLQENQVRAERAQLIAQRMNHHPPVENRQTLVDVAGCDAQARSRHLRRVHGL